MRTTFAALTTALLLPVAGASTLSFDGAFCAGSANGVGAAISCGNGSALNQAWGDTASVDVQYAGNSALPGQRSMLFWNTGYSGLENVAYGDSGASAQLSLVSLDGSRIQLDSMVFGSWLNSARTTRVAVYDLGSNALLFDSGAFSTAGASPNSLSFTNIASNSGLRLVLGPDFFNVGLDSLNYTVSAVPEPAPLALLAAGLAVLGWRRQRSSAR